MNKIFDFKWTFKGGNTCQVESKIKRILAKMNGFSTGEEDSRGPTDQICCLIDDNERCKNSAGNASYSKRIQKTVTTRRLKLSIDPQVQSQLCI